MKPIFSPNSELVGWNQDNKHIFDINMNWVAYIANGHVWSARTGNWLGPLIDGCALDQAGKVVAWTNSHTVRGTLRPLKPLKPLKPLQPLRPLRPLKPLMPLKPLGPLGGWSSQSWDKWINQ